MLSLLPEDYYFFSEDPLSVPELLIGFGALIGALLIVDYILRKRRK